MNIDAEKAYELKRQIKKVIPLLEEQYYKLHEPEVSNYLSRYKQVLDVLNKKRNEDITSKDIIKLLGCARSYMEVTSYYNQLFLNEMGKAEQIIKKIL